MKTLRVFCRDLRLMPREMEECVLNRRTIVLLLVATVLAWQPASAQGRPSIVINGVEAAFNPALGGYDVTAYASVVDDGGLPISGLEAEDFAISEDGREIEIFEVQTVDVGLSMILAIDTSGSMVSAGKIEAVRQAAASFIGGLSEQDEIGLISFNEVPKVEINITEDRAAVQNFVDLLQPVQGSATCLWDSAFEAVELAASAPAGRRAVVLLTDGIDELATGGACSTKTLEDVITLAADPAVLVPAYTVGIGNRVNAQELARLSDLTGGRASLAPTAEAVGDVFGELGLQFRGGYALQFRTDTTSGEHTLFIQVEHGGDRDQDTRKFRAPELAGEAIFSGIGQDQVINEGLSYSLEVSSPVAPDRVEFYLDDQLRIQDLEEPFEDTLDVAELAPGTHTLRAVVFGSSGEVLAASKIGFAFEEPLPEATEVPLSASVSFVEITEGQQIREPLTLTAKVDNEEAVARVEFLMDGFQIGQDAVPPFEVHWDPRFVDPGQHALSAVVIGLDDTVLDVEEVSVTYDPPTSLAVFIGVPALLAMAAGAYFVVRRRQARDALARDSVSPVVPPTPASAEADLELAEGETVETLAVLVIEACQDPELVGQHFEIWEDQVVIGRSSECDIVIPVQPVSRKHAAVKLQIPMTDASLTVDEIMLEEPTATGSSEHTPFHVFDGDPQTGRASTYGTFVDNLQAQPDAGLPLSDGSRIRLGRAQGEGRVPPVILRFEDLRRPGPGVADTDMTTDVLLSDAEAGEHQGDQTYETEDFSLTDDDDDLKTEEFGPDQDL